MRTKICMLAIAVALGTTASAQAGAYINEFHYDNASGDVGEFIEVVLDGGTAAADVDVWLYNGSDGELYTYQCVPTPGVDVFNVAADFISHGTLADGKAYYSVLPPSMQNGGPDGIALSIGGVIEEFLSYEGTFTATCAVANGVLSTDVGVAETSSTPVGSSLQRENFGSTWVLTEGSNTQGAINVGAATAYINEFHYDNASSDVGEFIEVALDSGLSAADVDVWLYNGSDGELYTYMCVPTPGVDVFNVAADFTFHGTLGDGKDYYSVFPPSIQNGGPDGIALSIGGVLVEFWSYEGAFTANCEVANGVLSTDVGVAETSSTPVGSSLQRIDFSDVWVLTEGSNTQGLINVGPPSGACCVDGGCSITTPGDCTGEYQGDGTTCDPNPCAPPLGACCDEATGVCTEGLTLEDCDANGGRWGGEGSDCLTIDPPCLPPIVGACCSAGFCAEVTEEGCLAGGGTYQGDDVACAAVSCPAGPTVIINEVRVDQPGSDNDEYFELRGDPGASLDGLAFLTIGDDSGDGTGNPASRSGLVESVVYLTGSVIPDDGHFLAVEGNNWSEDLAPLASVDLVLTSTPFPPGPDELNFENSDNVSHLLVAGFTGAINDLLDTDRDGFLDITPWAAVMDGISMIENPNGPGHTPPTGNNWDEWDYGFGGGIGPDGNFVPGYIYRCDPDGTWTIGGFNEQFAEDTPGTINELCPLSLDIKPGSCPNSFNPGSNGVLPVTLLGSADLDITEVNLSTVRLSRADGGGGEVPANVSPPGPTSSYEDTASPFEGIECDCHELGGDGIIDLVLKFRTQLVVSTLEFDDLDMGSLVPLVITGALFDGREFTSESDCVRLVPPGAGPGTVAVRSTVAGTWVDISPLDNCLDGGGFANFNRTWPETSVVTLTADTNHRGADFVGWVIDGVEQTPGEATIVLTILDESTVKAIYRPWFREKPTFETGPSNPATSRR